MASDISIQKATLNDVLFLEENLTQDDKDYVNKLYHYPSFMRLVECSAFSFIIFKSETRNEETTLNGNSSLPKPIGIAVFDVEPVNYFSDDSDIYEKIESVRPELRALNSLFLSLFYVASFNEEDYMSVFRQLANKVVNENTQVEAFIFTSDESDDIIAESRPFFDFIGNKRLWLNEGVYRIFYVKNITPKLFFRKAREEDQDNLSEISNSQTHLLSDQYGQFFLAEIISSEEDDKICLVAETEDKKAVGFAVVSLDINFDVITENYDLEKYNYFTKGDYYEAFKHKKNQLKQVEDLRKQLLVKKYIDELEYYKVTCSKNWLILELQEYCSSNKGIFLSEFQSILSDQEKQKLINKNIMKRKLEKLLKSHSISKPNEIWSKELDQTVSTCIMNGSDFLLETLRYFDLPVNYLEGEGHWSFWIKRKQDEKNEETKQKGILGKKKSKPKKKKPEDGKEGQLATPQWFDVEPFYVALQFYIDANQNARQLVCKVLETLKQKIASLFYLENGEMQDSRIVDLGDILEIIANDETSNLPENIHVLIPYILICFGGLQYDYEKVVINETTKTKNGKTKEKTNEKALKKIAFDELFNSVDRIKKNDYLFQKKSQYLKEIELKLTNQFEEQTEKTFEQTRRQFKADNYFCIPTKFGLNQSVKDYLILKEIPAEVKNAVCCNIFFIDKMYEHSSQHFLTSVFEQFEQFDYFILTLPHKTPEFKLLQSFIKAKKVKNSNFPHSLYIFYKSNLLNKYAKVSLIAKKDISLVNSSKGNNGPQKMTQFEFKIFLDIPNMPKSQIGKIVARKSFNMQQLVQFFDVTEALYMNAYTKTEALEIAEFDLHFIFEKMNDFVLKEILRLTHCKILIRSQENKKLDNLSYYFFYVKALSVFKLLMNSASSVFYNNKIKNRLAVEFEDEIQSSKKEAINSINSRCSKLPVSISLTTLRMLSNQRENITSRIMVIGASSCAMSFLEELLNHPRYNFVSIYLISESIDWEPQIIQTKPLKLEKLESQVSSSLLLERVSIIVGQVYFLDRKIKTVSVKTYSGNQFSLEYDFLIFTNGLEEKTFEIICDKKSVEEKIQKPKNMMAVDKLNVVLCEEICSNQNLSQFSYLNSHLNQNENFNHLSKLSASRRSSEKWKADWKEGLRFMSVFSEQKVKEYSQIREILNDDDNIANAFKERQHTFAKVCSNKILHPVILYGFSIEIMIVLEQLVFRWGVKPENIMLVIPRDVKLYEKENRANYGMTNDSRLEYIEKLTENPIGLNNRRVREFYFELLKSQNIGIYQNFEISDFSNQENTITLRNMSPAKVETKTGKDTKNQKNNGPNESGILHKSNMFSQTDKMATMNESATNSEESEEVFDYSLLITGDVFDISYQIFRTIQDNGLVYNGRLIVQSNYQTIDESIFGAGRICEFSQRYKSLAMGRSLRMDRYNQAEVGKALARSFVSKFSGDTQIEHLEFFKEPIGMNAKLYLGFYVIELEFPYQGKMDADQVLEYEISDLLDDESKQEYVSMGFDSNKLLKRLFYFGKREINLDVLKNLIGLHWSYFNHMFNHQKSELVKSFVDYINEGWAKAIFHPMFIRFKKLMSKICFAEKTNFENAEADKEKVMKSLIEENLVDFIVDNKSLFSYYYIPDFKKRLD